MISTVVALALAVSLQNAEAPQQQEESKPAKTEQQAQPKKICRYIRTSMSSRRKEKVCMTKDEWQAFNQGN